MIAAGLGVLLLLPALLRPTMGILLVGAVVAVWLASRSVAYPLALSGVAPVIDAVYGSNPLPKGGVTLIGALWIGLAVLLALIRGEHAVPRRALWSAPVLLSLLLLGLMLLRLGESPDEAYGSAKLQLYVADNLMFLVGGVFVGSRRKDLRLFLYLLLGVATLGALLLLFQLVSGSARTVVGERFSLSAQEYPIYLARNSADGLLIAIYAIVVARRLAVRVAALAVFPVLTVAMLAAGSRGPVLAFVVGLIALIALSAATRQARRRLLLVAAAVIVATIVVPLVVPGSAISRSLSTILGSATGLSTNGRSELWLQAYRSIGAHPLFGLGTGGFGAINPEQLYPHNIFLETAVELGVAGALIVLGIVVGAIRRLVARWRFSVGAERMDAAVLLALLAAATVNACFSGALPDNLDIWLWAGVAAGMSARAAAWTEGTVRAARMHAGLALEDAGFTGRGSRFGRGIAEG